LPQNVDDPRLLTSERLRLVEDLDEQFLEQEGQEAVVLKDARCRLLEVLAAAKLVLVFVMVPEVFSSCPAF